MRYLACNRVAIDDADIDEVIREAAEEEEEEGEVESETRGVVRRAPFFQKDFIMLLICLTSVFFLSVVVGEPRASRRILHDHDDALLITGVSSFSGASSCPSSPF